MLLALHADERALPGAGIEQHAVGSLPQLPERHVAPDLAIAAELHAHGAQGVYEPAEHVLRQTVGGDGISQAAARLGQALVERDLPAGLAQVVRSGKARGAGTDDGGALAVLGRGRLHELFGVSEDVVAHGALHRAHVQALVILLPVAALHAEMGADTARDGGHGVDLEDDGRGLVHFALAHFLHVGGDIGVRRAFAGAGGLRHLRRAEDGVVAVFAHHCTAEVAVLAGAVYLAAEYVGVAIVPAAHVLADVARDGGGVAQVRGGDAPGGVSHGGPAVLHGLAVGHSPERGPGSYVKAVLAALYPVEAGDAFEADDGLGIAVEQPVLEDAEQVGAAAHGHGARLRHEADGLVQALGSLILESLHACWASFFSLSARSSFAGVNGYSSSFTPQAL